MRKRSVVCYGFFRQCLQSNHFAPKVVATIYLHEKAAFAGQIFKVKIVRFHFVKKFWFSSVEKHISRKNEPLGRARGVPRQWPNEPDQQALVGIEPGKAEAEKR